MAVPFGGSHGSLRWTDFRKGRRLVVGTKNITPLLWFSVLAKGRRWTVHLSAADLTEELGCGTPAGERIAGLADPVTHSIYVDAGQSEKDVDSTTLHEILHVCLATTYVWPAERVVAALEQPLWRILKSLGFAWPEKPKKWRTLQRHAKRVNTLEK